ncbi:MAG: ABC transporter ATP-binding protein [bacterium]
MSGIGDPIIQTFGLTKNYRSKLAVDELSLTVYRGDIYGFLGQNGAGKSTTIKMLLGLLYPTKGYAKVLGARVPGELSKVLPKIGVVTESPAFYPYLTGEENLNLYAGLLGIRDKKRIRETLDKVNLLGIRQRFSEYSQGMRQRLGLALALLNDPELLILDEPTNGLDPQGIYEIKNIIKELNREGVTVFLSSHILSEVQEIATRVGVIHKGKLIAEGKVDELLTFGDRLTLMAKPRELVLNVLIGSSIVKDFTEDGDKFLVHVDKENISKLNRELVNSGIEVFALIPVRSTLEDFFISITGENHVVDRALQTF